MQKVICMSGGVDSTIAYFYLGDALGIWFNIHSRYSRKEEKAIDRLRTKYGLNIKKVDVLDLGKFEIGEFAYIPHRNFLFALLCAYFGDNIYIVGIQGDNVEDKSPKAFRIMEDAINSVRKKADNMIKIDSPFWDMTKGEIVRWFVNHVSKAEEILRDTMSCYSGEIEGSCGKCHACFRKWIALEVNNIDTAGWFENDLLKWEGIKEYVKRTKMGYYNLARGKEMKKVFQKYGLW